MTQLKATLAVKNGFNDAVLKVLGVSNYDYLPLSKNKKDEPLFIARQKKKAIAKKIIKDAESKILSLKEEKNKLSKKILDFKILEIELNNIKTELKDWSLSLNKKDTKEIEKNKDKINNSLDSIQELSMPDLQFLDQIIKDLEGKNKDKKTTNTGRKRRRRTPK
jgi:hypothetical protein